MINGHWSYSSNGDQVSPSPAGIVMNPRTLGMERHIGIDSIIPPIRKKDERIARVELSLFATRGLHIVMPVSVRNGADLGASVNKTWR